MLGFIVNPTSGNGNGKHVWSKVKADLDGKEIPYVFQLTARPGEAANLSAQMAAEQGVSRIIAIGGDGTVSETIEGVMQAKRQGHNCRFGLIPAGTGNDFARTHAIPTGPLQALELILFEPAGMEIDLLQTGDRIAVNCLGAGFDAAVAKMTNASGYKKSLNRIGLGKISYFISMLRVFLTYHPCRGDFEIDGEKIGLPSVWMAVTTNVPYFGGAMNICPHAVYDDGKADVVIISGKTRWELISILGKVYSGKHVNHPGVFFYKGNKISVTVSKPLNVHADGELMEETQKLDIQVLHKALHVIKHT